MGKNIQNGHSLLLSICLLAHLQNNISCLYQKPFLLSAKTETHKFKSVLFSMQTSDFMQKK